MNITINEVNIGVDLLIFHTQNKIIYLKYVVTFRTITPRCPEVNLICYGSIICLNRVGNLLQKTTQELTDLNTSNSSLFFYKALSSVRTRF